MINFEVGVQKKLLRGTEQLMSCQSEGTARDIITDGYSAIDNYLSAFLLQHKRTNGENHKKKLADAMDIIGKDFRNFKFERQDLLDFYELWKKCRYSVEKIEPSKAYKYKIIAVSFCDYLLDRIALLVNVDKKIIEEEIYLELQGARSQKYEEVVSHIHELIQDQAEEAADYGFGTRLGNKLMNPSNFSHFSLYSDDDITRKVIEESDDVHKEVALMYKSFMRIINTVRKERAELGVSDNEMNNFTLSLKTRFLGETAEETGNWFRQIVEHSMLEIQNKMNKKEKKD